VKSVPPALKVLHVQIPPAPPSLRAAQGDRHHQVRFHRPPRRVATSSIADPGQATRKWVPPSSGARAEIDAALVSATAAFCRSTPSRASGASSSRLSPMCLRRSRCMRTSRSRTRAAGFGRGFLSDFVVLCRAFQRAGGGRAVAEIKGYLSLGSRSSLEPTRGGSVSTPMARQRITRAAVPRRPTTGGAAGGSWVASARRRQSPWCVIRRLEVVSSSGCNVVYLPARSSPFAEIVALPIPAFDLRGSFGIITGSGLEKIKPALIEPGASVALQRPSSAPRNTV